MEDQNDVYHFFGVLYEEAEQGRMQDDRLINCFDFGLEKQK